MNTGIVWPAAAFFWARTRRNWRRRYIEKKLGIARRRALARLALAGMLALELAWGVRRASADLAAFLNAIGIRLERREGEWSAEMEGRETAWGFRFRDGALELYRGERGSGETP